MREFLKVHTISYFSSPKSEFWNCSFIDRWAAVTVIGNSRKHQMLWSTYQQVKGGTLKQFLLTERRHFGDAESHCKSYS